MYFFPSRVIVVFALAAAVAARAQQTIIFSKPADVPADKAKSSLLPTISYRASDFNAPHAFFNNTLPDLPAPAPRPALNNNDATVKDALDRRKNWTLMTPEQILGIQTPEQIMGMPDKAGGKKLSLEEQFLMRENQAASGTHTNAALGGAAWRGMDEANPFSAKDSPGEAYPFRQAQPKMEPGAKFFNGFLNAPSPAAGPEQNPGSDWNTAFSQPNRPKPTTEQQAEMERFRSLMEPVTPPEKPQVPTRFAVAPAPAPDPFLQALPVVNPAGRGISPLGDLFSRPAGIKPLPGISTPAPTAAASKPSWQAQLPPWMTTGPQPHNPNWTY